MTEVKEVKEGDGKQFLPKNMLLLEKIEASVSAAKGH